MHRNLQALVFGAAIGSSPVCGQSESELSSVRAAISESHQTYAASMKARDAAALTEHFTDDAVLLPEGADMQKGRAKIQQWFGSWLPAAVVREFDITTEDLVMAGDTACEVGTFRMTRAAEGAIESSSLGKYLMIWKRCEDGKWRIMRDMFNTSTRPNETK